MKAFSSYTCDHWSSNNGQMSLIHPRQMIVIIHRHQIQKIDYAKLVIPHTIHCINLIIKYKATNSSIVLKGRWERERAFQFNSGFLLANIGNRWNGVSFVFIGTNTMWHFFSNPNGCFDPLIFRPKKKKKVVLK